MMKRGRPSSGVEPYLRRNIKKNKNPGSVNVKKQVVGKLIHTRHNTYIHYYIMESS